MSVMIKITLKIPRFPFTLETSSGKQFKVLHIDSERVSIETGKKPSTLKIPVSALEEAPNFLRGKGWIRIGAVHEISDELSLDTFLKRFSHGTSLASYVAPLLELAEIAKIDRNRPAKIRLKASC
ncbi:hypothetical protein E3J74_02925 [Candidatus Bathyarchaeota archaeon]|nr:MAG: hypothetical protein E3J74_02925 [Candidatus Bathyarchaeota archaeon]